MSTAMAGLSVAATALLAALTRRRMVAADDAHPGPARHTTR